jgi:prophage regulatory protein
MVEHHVERMRPRDDVRIVRMKELSQMIGASEWTIRRWRQKGMFPAPVQLGERNIGWLVGDIRQWLEERKGGDR